ADRADRRLEIAEVEERLDHEQVGAAALEHARLVGVAAGGVGTDRPGDEDVASGDLARLACEPDSGARDLLELVVEEVLGELRPVGAERVRLDQLRSGADVAEM